MIHTQDLDQFLLEQRISKEQFSSSKIDWNLLNCIADDHLNNQQSLGSVAEFCAKIANLHKKVHSIRWRIKDANHLKAKIIRKVIEGNEKYLDINVENYKNKITDLVGIRILHLYKDDVVDILQHLSKYWAPSEDPVAYIRKDDNIAIYDKCKIKTIEHKSGYRSVHYIFSSSPSKNTVLVEAQIRTIFEEGWSEIDHNLRYPNYQPSETTEYFLKIFNRLAGSADEMGDFVNKLEISLKKQDECIKLAESQSQKYKNEIESLIEKLEAANGITVEHTKIIESLKSKILNSSFREFDVLPVTNFFNNQDLFQNRNNLDTFVGINNNILDMNNPLIIKNQISISNIKGK